GRDQMHGKCAVGKRLGLLGLLVLAAIGCQDGHEERGDPNDRLSGQNPATMPTPRGDDLFRKRHRQFSQRATKGDIDVLFLGDSITEQWYGQGMDIWKRELRPLGAENFGMSADRTETMLWRLSHGELDGISPRVVVLMIGTNNLKSGPIRMSPTQTAEGVREVLGVLHARVPGAKVLLMGILPRQPKYEWFPAVRKDTNRRLSTLEAEREYVRFIDFSDRFLDTEGNLREELYRSDRLHLSREGYEIWADAIRQPIRDALQQD
ncbi:MAG: GDSL-type esterase/lipase family protein, partial [Phycisphaerae bacterium]